MKTIPLYIDEWDEEINLMVGQNKFENDHLIRTSQPNDLWFHLENLSGPHFVLKLSDHVHDQDQDQHRKMKTIPKKYLNKVGGFFREFKTGLSSNYHVIYTEIHNVTLTNELGSVIPKKTKRIKF